MRFLLSVGICAVALYAADACFCGGIYFDAAQQLIMQLKQYF